MTIQMAIGRKAQFTPVTFEWLLPSMNAHMTFQRAILSKA